MLHFVQPGDESAKDSESGPVLEVGDVRIVFVKFETWLVLDPNKRHCLAERYISHIEQAKSKCLWCGSKETSFSHGAQGSERSPRHSPGSLEGAC